MEKWEKQGSTKVKLPGSNALWAQNLAFVVLNPCCKVAYFVFNKSLNHDEISYPRESQKYKLSGVQRGMECIHKMHF